MSAIKEKIRSTSHFAPKLVKQLVGDFRKEASSKPGRPTASGEDERLHGKLHILQPGEGVKRKIAQHVRKERLEAKDAKLIIFVIHVDKKKGCILEIAFKDTIQWRNRK